MSLVFARVKRLVQVSLKLTKTSKSAGGTRLTEWHEGMLLYSCISLAVSDYLYRINEARRHSNPLPIVIGFPCSCRPFLDPERPETATDLAIRITFGQIALPGEAVEIKPGSKSLRFRLVQGARLAKRQFVQRFDPSDRGFFLADTYMRTLDRLL